MQYLKTYENFQVFESKSKKFPNLKEYNIEGFTVLVGMDAKSNDYLTVNIADDNDIWLHTRGIPGSHVIIIVKEKQLTGESTLPTRSVLIGAAKLAKKNSKATKDEPCKVVWCHKKFVIKKSTMKDGEVALEEENLTDDNFITV